MSVEVDGTVVSGRTECSFSDAEQKLKELVLSRRMMWAAVPGAGVPAGKPLGPVPSFPEDGMISCGGYVPPECQFSVSRV